MKLSAFLLTFLISLFTLSQVQAQVGPSFSLAASTRSELKASRLLDDLAVHLVLTLGYTESSADARNWRIESLPGLRGKRYFIRAHPQVGTQTVELAFRRASAGGLELLAYGQQFDPQGRVYTNPDLTGLQTRATGLVTAATAPPTGPQTYGYELYQLSYLQADRAIAMLKTLGYTTVEYSASAGETLNDRIYNSYMSGQWKLPAIVKMIDATKTSLMDPPPAGSYPQQQQAYGAVTTLGGTFLHQMTSGEPQQRIMIVYDENDIEPLQSLLNLLRQKLDQPARQIVIEALVIEVNTDKVKQLGLDFHSGDGDVSTGFGFDQSNPSFATRTEQPFSFQIWRNALSDVMTFRLKLTGLIESGDAEILSSPSVLVLDGRQARIQIGQQVPVSKSVSTTAGFASGVEYIQTGIVLNLRPRISEDGSEISMQVETIVSAVNEALSIEETAQNVLLAPRIDNRQVQTFVRVADNTPFIIGGLISTDIREKTTGIPLRSQIPILGVPFRRKSTDVIKKEVIVSSHPTSCPSARRASATSSRRIPICSTPSETSSFGTPTGCGTMIFSILSSSTRVKYSNHFSERYKPRLMQNPALIARSPTPPYWSGQSLERKSSSAGCSGRLRSKPVLGITSKPIVLSCSKMTQRPPTAADSGHVSFTNFSPVARPAVETPWSFASTPATRARPSTRSYRPRRASATSRSGPPTPTSIV